MKEIRKEEMEYLLKEKILRNSKRGLINDKGYTVSFYKTKTKRYIEDKYADIARLNCNS